jgi:hypothetical protein
MADIDKFSKQVIDLAERLADVADAAKGKGIRRGSIGTRWVLLPAAGAGLYALATSDSFARRTKDAVNQAKARASDLPDDLLNRVRQASPGSPARAGSPNARKSSSARRSGAGRKTSSARKSTSAR